MRSHIDVKKLGRIVGGARHRRDGQPWARTARPRRRLGIRVCIYDATRLAYVEVLEDKKAGTAIGFLRRALAFYARHGVHVQRVMSDNGPAYMSWHTGCLPYALRVERDRTIRRKRNCHRRPASTLAIALRWKGPVGTERYIDTRTTAPSWPERPPHRP